MTRVNTLTEIWNTYNNNILSENVPGEKASKMGTKPGKPPVKANDIKKGFDNDNSSGPGNVEVLQEPIDPKTAKEEDELYNSARFSSEKYTKKDKKLEKKVKESINNYMKSTFDKLFENVMGEEMHSDNETQELDALGIDTEVEETDEGDVTVTLDREMAKALCDLLQAAMGDEDDDAEVEDYEMEEMEEDQDEDELDEDELDEAVEMHAVADSAGLNLTHPGHNKVGKLKAKGNKASDSAKIRVEGEPKAVADSKAKLTNTKNNKVDSSLKAGADYIN